MTLSVIIPTLDEEACLPTTLRAVRAQKPHEIIVVDGGSTDGTRRAADGVDHFIEAPQGRGCQMNHGTRHARGDTLLFLHADCVPEEGALAEAERCLRQRGVVAGCFVQTVTDDSWLYRCIDRCASARVRLTGIVYGDQGLFVRRDLFERCGGFPEVGLMEDLFLCLQLRRHGRVVVAPKRIFVSPRRWRQVGIIQQTLRNWALLALTVSGVSPSRLARFYPAVR